MIAQSGVSFVNQWFDQYWLLITKAAIVLIFFLVTARRGLRGAQGARAHAGAAGPDVRGTVPRVGAAPGRRRQVRAEGGRDPRGGRPVVFSLAPAVWLVPYIALFVVIPFSDEIFILNLDVGIFFVMAITSVTVIGVLMAGWASANKFSLIGALRAAAQLIAYELPLVLGAAAIVMQAGTLSMIGIVEAQRQYWFAISQPIGLGIFLVASLAELDRPPFDMPVADSEIIFGAFTEYGSEVRVHHLLAEVRGNRRPCGGSRRPVPRWLSPVAGDGVHPRAAVDVREDRGALVPHVLAAGHVPRLREDQPAAGLMSC